MNLAKVVSNILPGEKSRNIVFLADLPKGTTYQDIYEFYESRVGPCRVSINR